MLLKQCNNRKEAVTEGFPCEFIKPVEKRVHRHCAVISGGVRRGQSDSVKCRGTCPPSVISLFIMGLPRRGTYKELCTSALLGLLFSQDYKVQHLARE